MKTALFFCDINGTITGTDSLHLLASRLEILKEVFGCNKFIFSIASTENLETVKKYVSKIKKHCNNIIFGKQFYENGYIDYENDTIHDDINDKTKLGQMMNYIKEINGKEDISLICYADDNANEMFGTLFSTIVPNSEIKIMIPSKKINSQKIISSEKKAIEGLYECLDSVILNYSNEINDNEKKK